MHYLKIISLLVVKFVCTVVSQLNLTEMDELLSLDATSVFSSIAEAPVRLDRQYSPLEEVFQSNSTDLPDHRMPEPNSEGRACAFPLQNW